MIILFTALAAGLGAALATLAALAWREERRRLAGRLEQVAGPEAPSRTGESGLFPALGARAGRWLRRRLPPAWFARLRRRLLAAGVQTPAEQFIGRWAILAATGALAAGALALAVPAAAWPVAGALALAALAPLWRLGAREAERRRRLRKDFPFLLDFLAMTLAAGLSLDSGLLRAGQKLRGPLGEELQRYAQNTGRGMARREALLALAEGIRLPEADEFVQVLIHSEGLGLPLADVLRAQAGQCREDRRLQAEEAAQRIPIKLLFPLVFFIFPTLFAIVLGPAAIWMIEHMQGWAAP